ncbi:hypothetical protein C8J56DRAFT_905175 [Mycena floridula]|nr:hypothetical protein C8J56DRAFT_905175 [Mycena floridula]
MSSMGREYSFRSRWTASRSRSILQFLVCDWFFVAVGIASYLLQACAFGSPRYDRYETDDDSRSLVDLSLSRQGITFLGDVNSKRNSLETLLGPHQPCLVSFPCDEYNVGRMHLETLRWLHSYPVPLAFAKNVVMASHALFRLLSVSASRIIPHEIWRYVHAKKPRDLSRYERAFWELMDGFKLVDAAQDQQERALLDLIGGVERLQVFNRLCPSVSVRDLRHFVIRAGFYDYLASVPGVVSSSFFGQLTVAETVLTRSSFTGKQLDYFTPRDCYELDANQEHVVSFFINIREELTELSIPFMALNWNYSGSADSMTRYSTLTIEARRSLLPHSLKILSMPPSFLDIVKNGWLQPQSSCFGSLESFLDGQPTWFDLYGRRDRLWRSFVLHYGDRTEHLLSPTHFHGREDVSHVVCDLVNSLQTYYVNLRPPHLAVNPVSIIYVAPMPDLHLLSKTPTDLHAVAQRCIILSKATLSPFSTFYQTVMRDGSDQTSNEFHANLNLDDVLLQARRSADFASGVAFRRFTGDCIVPFSSYTDISTKDAFVTWHCGGPFGTVFHQRVGKTMWFFAASGLSGRSLLSDSLFLLKRFVPFSSNTAVIPRLESVTTEADDTLYVPEGQIYCSLTITDSVCDVNSFLSVFNIRSSCYAYYHTFAGSSISFRTTDQAAALKLYESMLLYWMTMLSGQQTMYRGGFLHLSSELSTSTLLDVLHLSIIVHLADLLHHASYDVGRTSETKTAVFLARKKVGSLLDIIKSRYIVRSMVDNTSLDVVNDMFLPFWIRHLAVIMEQKRVAELKYSQVSVGSLQSLKERVRDEFPDQWPKVEAELSFGYKSYEWPFAPFVVALLPSTSTRGFF